MKRKQRIGDKVVTTIEESAVIQFDDILAGCTVESEDEYETPWDNCDGWDHHLEDCPGDMDSSSCNAVIRHNRDYRHKLIVMDYPVDDCCGRMYGASKQVKAELRACAKRRFIAQLKKWYEDGWEWYFAQCEFTTDDGTEYHNTCGMIDDYDYAMECATTEVIRKVIYDLEKDGYVVENQPNWKANYVVNCRQAKVDQYRRNLNSQNWNDD